MYTGFLVALFGEMYGFPLTIFFISSFFSLPTFDEAFLTYMRAYGMPVGFALNGLGIALMIPGWISLHRAGEGLATGGVYKYVRHPQYLGIILLTLGWVIYWPTFPTVIMWPTS